ncbi:hypothetical protein FACS189413_17400 [Bacteroidia bacterium]|nr:hypothetical protein FACS189463_1540 [Bacteroidia bacterium]GHU73238.1 hypothetical protein FACS189413_17400 [Bacteroidia bacterium]
MKNIEEIKEETEGVINQYFDNISGNYIGSNNNYCNIPEFMLQSQQEYIEMLKQEIQCLKEELASLKESII